MLKGFRNARGSGILFLVPVGAQAIITLGSIPVIITSAGDSGWASIAVGQAVGSFCAVVCGLGWNVTGPSLVAGADGVTRKNLLRSAFLTRLMVFFPLIILGLFVVQILGLQRPDLASLGVVSTLVVALTMQWYFIGLNSPVELVIYDSIPRIFTMTAGWLLVFGGANVVVGLVGQILASIIAVAIVCLKFGAWDRDCTRSSFPNIVRIVLRQREGLSTQVFPAILSYSPIVAITIFSPGIAPLYALIDKVHKQLVTGLVPIGNIVVAKLLQRFARDTDSMTSTARIALMQLGGIGLVSCLTTAVISGPLIRILSRNTMHLDAVLVVLLSVLVGLTVVVALLPSGLMAPVGRLREASTSLFWGVLFGAVAVGVLTPYWGAQGALIGQIGGYAVATMLQSKLIRSV